MLILATCYFYVSHSGCFTVLSYIVFVVVYFILFNNISIFLTELIGWYGFSFPAGAEWGHGVPHLALISGNTRKVLGLREKKKSTPDWSEFKFEA